MSFYSFLRALAGIDLARGVREAEHDMERGLRRLRDTTDEIQRRTAIRPIVELHNLEDRVSPCAPARKDVGEDGDDDKTLPDAVRRG